MNAVTRKKPKANSRNKGAAFERAIALELALLTGVNFKRDIEQYRAADHGDLIPDNPAWPFVLECKRYAKGVSCLAAWKEQASAAALAAGKLPAVIFKFNLADVRVAVPFSAVCAAFGGAGGGGEWAEISMDGLAFLAAEIMARESA